MDLSGQKLPALITAVSSSFLTPYMVSSINIALPAIQKDLRADAVSLSWVATAYLLSTAVSLVPAGRIGDIYGRKRIFLLGLVVFTGSSLLCGLAGSIKWFICFRILQGIGSAMIFSTRMAILTSVFPPGERGLVLGINVTAVYTGLSCGPFVGGMLTQHFGWRSIFLLIIPFAIPIVLFIVSRLKGEWADAAGESFDAKGAMIYSLTLIAVIYGISKLPGLPSLGLLLLGFAGLFIFVKWELSIRFPVFEVRLFQHNRIFSFSCLAALIHYSATFAVNFMLSLYLQYIKGLTPLQAGLLLISQPVMMAVFSPLAGKWSDKIQPRWIASTGMGLTSASLFLLAQIGPNTSFTAIIACLMILGFGFGLFSSPNMNAIMSAVAKRYYGIAAGSVATMRLLGQMFSMGIATLIFALFIGPVQITPEFYPNFMAGVRFAFTVFALLCLGGVFLSLTRGMLPRKEK